MIPLTLAQIEPIVPEAAKALGDLEQDWPVGATVRHTAGGGWTGEITCSDPYGTDPTTPGILHDGAHTLLYLPPGPHGGAVCVTHQLHGETVVAWYMPHVLRRVDAPAEVKAA